MNERFILETVTQVTVRGPNFNRLGRNGLGKPLVVHQEADVDKLPAGHPAYEVPLYYDPSDDGGGDVTPPEHDPDDPGTVGTYTAYDTVVKIRGTETFTPSSHSVDIRVAVMEDNGISPGTDIRIYGEDVGTIIIW